MASSTGPQFFCARPNGTLTPLIPVDELPPHVSVRGVPRTLSPAETQGMTSLGTMRPRGQSYIVEGVPQVTARASPANANGHHRSRDFELHSALMRLATDDTIPAPQRMAANSVLQQSAPQSWPMNNPANSNWLVPSGSGGSGGAGARQSNPLTKKEFCSYWIRHGECDYQQQGCLYKHEMPRDLATLEKLGLRDIPRWFREKYNIASLIPSGHSHPRAQGTHGQQWKEDTPDRAVKSIQYPPHLDLNGSVDTTDVDKGSKQKSPSYTAPQQSPAVITGPSRSAFPNPTNNSPKVASHHKQAGRYGSQFGPTVKRHDLLSFDPLPEYPSLNAMGPGIGALNYSSTRDDAEPHDRSQHEEFLRGMQALMPNSEYLPNPFDMPSGQRSKKTQKSRRLYQARPQAMGPETRFDNADYDPYKGANTPTAAGSSVGASVAKDNVGSQFASPLTGPVTEPSTRNVSPSANSCSSRESPISPRVIQPQASDKDNGSLPSPIGSKRTQQKKPMGSSHDFFKISSSHGK